MSDVENELDKKEDENLELEDQEQEDLQDDAEHQEDEQDDEQAEADEQDEEDESDEDEEEPPKPSRREQLRIQQLLQKMHGNDDDQPKKSQKPADKTVFDEDDSEDDDRFRKGLEEASRFIRFETRLEVDAPRVEAKYPQLNEDSDKFNPVLADTINRMYLGAVGFNGKSRSVKTDDVRYFEYVESMFELASEIAGETVETSTTNLKKQMSKTGLRPGGGATKRLNLNKAPSEMTDEELEAVIAQTIPKKR